MTGAVRRLLGPMIASCRRLLRRRRVPVIHQLSTVDCGAACLAMVLRFHRRAVPVADVREACAPGRDGVTVRTLLVAARAFGLRAKAYSVELGALRHFALPAILHWGFNHYVVLERCTPSGAVIVDPGGGRRRLSVTELSERFTGVLVALEPRAGFQPPAGVPHKRVWMRFLTSVMVSWQSASALGQIIAASLILQLTGLAFPAITALVVDWVLPMQVSDSLSILALGMVAILVLKAVLSYLRATLLLRLRVQLDTRMMMTFFEHLLSLPFRFFQMRSRGDLLMRLSSNSVIRETLTNQSLSVVLDGSFVVVSLVILLALASDLALLVLGLGALQVLMIATTMRPMRRLMERELATKAEEQSYLVETLGGIATLKVAGAEGHAFDRWSNLFFGYLNISLHRSQLLALLEAVMGTLRTASPLVLLWYGAGQVLGGAWSLGAMLAFNAIGSNFLSPLSGLVSSAQSLQLLGAHLTRITDVLEAEPERDLESQVAHPSRLQGAIEVDGVSFRYQADGPEVLSDISFSVEPSQKVALVGATGSGKTTLGLLLLGLMPPDAGEVRFDGYPASSLGLRFLRSQVGVVLQDASLFSGSIRSNISFTRPEMAIEEVIEAARMAAIHDDVAGLPMAYETLVAESGSAVSGGQKQRIAIARALASRPAILVLDEATSHLDQKTEEIVDRHLSALRCTRIVIAHRLSTVRNADRILVLDRGRLVEQGTHAELAVRANGHYADLVRAQASEDTGQPLAVAARAATAKRS